MTRLKSILGYAAAALTVAAAVLTPFLLIGFFSGRVAATGVRVDAAYTGGDVVREIARGAYRVRVHRAVYPHTRFQRIDPYVQLDWTPAAALPARISEEVDLDGDGKPDLLAQFSVPRDDAAPLRVDVEPLARGVKPMRSTGKESFSALIARVGDAIVVRVPLETGAR